MTDESSDLADLAPDGFVTVSEGYLDTEPNVEPDEEFGYDSDRR